MGRAEDGPDNRLGGVGLLTGRVDNDVRVAAGALGQQGPELFLLAPLLGQ